LGRFRVGIEPHDGANQQQGARIPARRHSLMPFAMKVRTMTSVSYCVDLIPINAGIGPDAIFEGGREAWLQKIIDIWRPYFLRLGHDLATRIWISPGRPPSNRWTGACYPGAAGDDGNPHIFIHPVLSDSTRVAGVVVHQLCHVALGNRSHGPPFRRLARAMGLMGKMTETIEGPLFLAIMPATIDRIGPYPHPALRQLRRLDRKLARTV
jgi:hypothetical protein